MIKNDVLPQYKGRERHTLTNYRRLIQSFFLVLYFIFPLFGIFYFNLDSGSFVLLGKNIGMNNSFIFMLGFLALLFGVITMAVTTGRSFCGWVCPQNFLSEVINKIITRFSLKSDGSKKLVPYAVITFATLIFSLAVSISFMFYFGKPSEIYKDLVSGELDATVAVFALFFGLLVFAGIGIFRHDFCKHACPYGIMQAAIADKTTLRVRFAKERSEECINCSACTDICYMKIEPRMLNQADPGCMNCGLCVEACENVLEPMGFKSMLNFHGDFKDKETLNSKALIIMPTAFVTITAAFIYIFLTLPVIDITLSRNESAVSVLEGDTVSGKYFIELINQSTDKNQLALNAEGLPENSYTFSSDKIELALGEKKQVELTVKLQKSSYKTGIQQFNVLVTDGKGKKLNTAKGSVFIP